MKPLNSNGTVSLNVVPSGRFPVGLFAVPLAFSPYGNEISKKLNEYFGITHLMLKLHLVTEDFFV